MKTRIKASRNSYTTAGQISTLTIVSLSGVQHVVQFDSRRLEAVQAYCWRWEDAGPITTIPDTDTKLLLQRLLMNVQPWDQRKVKFVNGDRSDMRLKNMRLGPAPKTKKPDRTRQNWTGVVGVNHRKWRDAHGRHRPYQAWTAGTPRRSLGHFAKLEDAAEARAAWIEQNDWEPKTRGRKTGWRKNKQTQGEQ